MLGRNHALWGLAGWAAAWPTLAAEPVASALNSPDDLGTFALTGLIAGGASVLPDLDHPDARPSRHFGPLTRLIARGVHNAAGGHRMATHSLVFAVGLAVLAAAAAMVPGNAGRWAAAVMCGTCCSMGLALIGPSLGLRIPSTVDLIAAVAAGWWAWHAFGDIRWLLPVIAAYGVLAHIACDIVTKGGVPVLWPFTRRRFALSLFRVGGPGEQVASLAAFALLGYSTWRAVAIVS